jgi:hypothetical protein
MPNLISSQTLSSSTASFSFNSITDTFTDLLIVGSIRVEEGSFTNEQIRIRFNGVSTSSYSHTFLRGDGGGMNSARGSSQTSGFVGLMNTTATTSNAFSSFSIYIPSYLSSTSKQTSTLAIMEDNGTTAYSTTLSNLAAISAAITSITFTTGNARNFVSGTSFYLYGIKNS